MTSKKSSVGLPLSDLRARLLGRIRASRANKGVRPRTLKVTREEALGLMEEVRCRAATGQWTPMGTDGQLKLAGVVLVDAAGVPYEWDDNEDVTGTLLLRRRPLNFRVTHCVLTMILLAREISSEGVEGIHPDELHALAEACTIMVRTIRPAIDELLSQDE